THQEELVDFIKIFPQGRAMAVCPACAKWRVADDHSHSRYGTGRSHARGCRNEGTGEAPAPHSVAGSFSAISVIAPSLCDRRVPLELSSCQGARAPSPPVSSPTRHHHRSPTYISSRQIFAADSSPMGGAHQERLVLGGDGGGPLRARPRTA